MNYLLIFPVTGFIFDLLICLVKTQGNAYRPKSALPCYPVRGNNIMSHSAIAIVQSSRDHTRLIAYQGTRTLGYIQKYREGFKAQYTMRTQGPMRSTADLAAIDLAEYKRHVNQVCDLTNASMLNAMNQRLEPTVTYGRPAPELVDRPLVSRKAPTMVRSASGYLVSID